MRSVNLQWVSLILLVVLLVATVARSDPEPQPCVLPESVITRPGYEVDCNVLASTPGELGLCTMLLSDRKEVNAIFDEIDREFADVAP